MRATTPSPWEVEYFAAQRQPEYLANVARQIADFGIDARGREVLDIGCGPGSYLHTLAKQSPRRLVGLDVSSYYTAMLSNAEPEARCVQGSVVALPFPAESFDLVLLLNVIWHVNSYDAIAEARRVLRPGGLLWVSHNLPTYYWWKIRFRKGRPLRQYIIESLSSIKRVAEPHMGSRRRIPCMSRDRLEKAIAPLSVERTTVIASDGIPCQILMTARKPQT